MTGNSAIVAAALNRRFLADYPSEAARSLEAMSFAAAAQALATQPASVIALIWNHLVTDVAVELFVRLPATAARNLLSDLDPAAASALLQRLKPETREQCLAALDPRVGDELRALLAYAPDSAGRLMNPHVITFRRSMSTRTALARLRAVSSQPVSEIMVIDDDNRLDGRVALQDLALADPRQPIETLIQPLIATVPDTASREEVVATIEQYKLSELPVVDFAGRLIGIIHQSALVTALTEETSLDIQTMVGASRDERALSGVHFAVTKRLPWLHINLLTAFVAAAVVGIFENTIAQFTALAVLLPVVAGQSGNAGAQALAVTMRGLALREIGTRHWPRIVLKEINVGFLNGLAIALTTAIGVYLWSRSAGLALVIAIAMVLSMVAAGLSGALIPVVLTRLRQDPAQASTIFLTTVTDVVGFFSFLGTATLLAGFL